MSYIGNTPTQQEFTAAIDYFSGNGSTVAFTLSRPVASVAQVQVNVNNVAQNPSTAFTVSGNTITFTGAPSSGTNNIYVQYTSPITQVIQPGQGTVGATQLASGLAFSQWTTTGSNIYYNTGSVGIGTSSPSAPLAIGRVNSAEEGGQIDLCRSSDNASAWGIDVFGSTSTPSLRFVDNVASATRMAIDGSGNVGIGTSSPGYPLDVLGDMQLKNNSSNYSRFKFGQYNTGSSYTFIQGDGRSSGFMAFYTDVTERARIDSSGNLLVGTTSDFIGGAASSVQAKSATTATYGFYRATSTAASGIGFFYSDNHGTASAAAYFKVDGGLANYSANNTNLSDVRTKTDIKDAGSYLAKICAIPVRTFKYNNVEGAEDNLGVIAQEVEAVAPELVDSTGWGEVVPEDGVPLKAIYQTDLQYALMKCIQEQQVLITTLTERITALEAK